MPNQTLPQIMSTTHFKYKVYFLVNSKTGKSADKPWFMRKYPSVNLDSVYPHATKIQGGFTATILFPVHTCGAKRFFFI